jgi:AraC-like DNA-binding protein
MSGGHATASLTEPSGLAKNASSQGDTRRFGKQVYNRTPTAPMTGTLENLTDLPSDGASGDLLSHVLAQVRLTGDHVRSHEVAPSEGLDLEVGAAYVLVVAEGSLNVVGDGSEPILIDTGDLVLLPRGLGRARLVAWDVHTSVIVCRFRFDPHGLRGMTSALPGCIHIRRAEGAGWLEGIVPFLMVEVTDDEPGAALMISRIIDVIVIRALRTWVQRRQTTGWLGALSDPRIARALLVMHERPLRRWSVEALADAAGMSRSSFCERFAALVGRSPVRYQNEWRLNLARDMLAARGARVGEIALRVGYESEAAFSRAYKALFGHPPRDEPMRSGEAG